MKYDLPISREHFCVPAVLQAVLRNEGYDIEQNDIASVLGVNIPSEKAEDYQNIVGIKLTEDEKMWGVVLHKNSVNDLFNYFGIKLHEDYIPISTIAEEVFFDTIKNCLSNYNHLICGFNYSALFGNSDREFGHVALICEVDKCENISILDPGPLNSGYKSVKSDDLYYAIKRISDGLWCIS